MKMGPSLPARPLLLALLATAALPLLAFGPAQVSGAAADEGPLSPTRLLNLRVEGGSGWHAENSFRLDWDLETPAGAKAVVAIHYRVRNTDGSDAIGERALPRVLRVESIHLPADGTYAAEVWAVDEAGLRSPAASVSLRLDRTRPGTARPLPPGGWIAGEQAAHLRLGHPEGAEPPAGLRGYAVSIDANPTGSPCSGSELCSDVETDLRGGPSDDSLLLTGLPEGRLFVHVLAVSGSGMRSQSVGTAALWIDATAPRVSLSGAPSGWVNEPALVLASATDALSGMAAAGPSGPFTSLAVDGGIPTARPGAEASALVSGDGVHRIEARARDAAGNLTPANGEPPPTAMLRIDTKPPAAAFANRPDPLDPTLVEAYVSDGLSGPSAKRGTIAVRPARSRQPFLPLPTAVSGGRLRAHWDPDAHAAGSYEFEATVYDEAGNSASTGLRGNGTRMVMLSAEKVRTSLRAGFGPRRAASFEAACRRGATLGGTLTTANGVPLAGEEVVLSERFDAGASDAERTRTLRTAADGSFSADLGPGPSRRLQLSFAGGHGRTPSSSPPLRLESRACLTLRASTARARIGGRPVVFTGRVGLPATVAPKDGVPVSLQFRLPGLPWSEFRTITTNRRGRFRYPYAFSDDDSRGVRFQFRALVAAHDGWPFATGTSRAISVTGR